MRVLVVEDEAKVGAFLVKGLEAEGYVVHHVTTARDAIERAPGFDLVILDLGLPDMDGSEVLRAMRAGRTRVPVIVVTARGSVEDVVETLDIGADDYLTKPFAFRELLARMRARWRRAEDDGSAAVIGTAAVKLDLRAHRAHVGGREVDLSTREFALLETFVRHRGQVLSRQQLLSSVWGLDFEPGSNVVDVYVRYLREKIGVGVIETVRGSGYRLLDEG